MLTFSVEATEIDRTMNKHIRPIAQHNSVTKQEIPD